VTTPFLRPKRAGAGIDMAPLIDCVFILLLFFMLSSSFMMPALPLKLPGLAAEEMPEPTRLVLSIDRDDVLYAEQQPLPWTALESWLNDQATAHHDRPVLLRGDREVRYERVMQVISAARRAGFTQLSLQHETAIVTAP
jgi:biopolymer transport protein ExbD